MNSLIKRVWRVRCRIISWMFPKFRVDRFPEGTVCIIWMGFLLITVMMMKEGYKFKTRKEWLEIFREYP